MGIYIHKIVTINNHFNYFSTIYFKKRQRMSAFIKVTGTYEGRWYAETDSIQHVTEADKVKMARDFKCAELFKTAAITVAVGALHKERESIRQTTGADWLRSDFKCTGLSKTRPPSHVLVTLVAYINVYTHI
jgi:hypothetical protein